MSINHHLLLSIKKKCRIIVRVSNNKEQDEEGSTSRRAILIDATFAA